MKTSLKFVFPVFVIFLLAENKLYAQLDSLFKGYEQAVKSDSVIREKEAGAFLNNLQKLDSLLSKKVFGKSKTGMRIMELDSIMPSMFLDTVKGKKGRDTLVVFLRLDSYDAYAQYDHLVKNGNGGLGKLPVNAKVKVEKSVKTQIDILPSRTSDLKHDCDVYLDHISNLISLNQEKLNKEKIDFKSYLELERQRNLITDFQKISCRASFIRFLAYKYNIFISN